MNKKLLAVILCTLVSPLFAQNSSRTIGDTGPGGGIIFAVEGDKYMEVSHRLGEYNWPNAINFAGNYEGGGFTDWRLPTVEELRQIYRNLKVKRIGKLDNRTYWSSNESSNRNFAITFDLGYGNTEDIYKNFVKRSVRAVRGIPISAAGEQRVRANTEMDAKKERELQEQEAKKVSQQREAKRLEQEAKKVSQQRERETQREAQQRERAAQREAQKREREQREKERIEREQRQRAW